MREEILAFIKKATRRIRNQYFIECALWGVMISLAVTFVFLGVSLVVTIPYANEKGIGIVIVGMILCSIYSVSKAPKRKDITFKVDQTGLEERLSTALMLLDSEDPLSELQREDTLVHIKAYNLKKHFPYHCSIKKLGVNILLILMCVGVCMIPTKAKQEEEALRHFQKEKQELTDKVEEQIEKLQENEEISPLTQEEVANLLEKTKEEVPKAQDKDEIKKSMERLAKKLDNLSKEKEKAKEQEAISEINKALTESFQKKAQQEAQSDLDALSETLSQNEWTKDLAESLKEDDSDEALEETLQALQEQIEELSEAEKEALANALSQAASGLNSQQLASQLSQASSNLATGKISTNNLQAALKSLKQTASGNGQNQLSQGNGQNQNGSQASQSNGSGTGNSQSQGNGNGSGNGQGQGNGSGSGNGQGQGSGNGSGSGQGGGWNTGSKQGNEKDSTGNKADTIPELPTGYDANLSGAVNEEATIEQGEIAHGINIAGEKIDYHSVVGDYAEEALENIEQEPVPEHMKEAIKDYFEAINQ